MRCDKQIKLVQFLLMERVIVPGGEDITRETAAELGARVQVGVGVRAMTDRLIWRHVGRQIRDQLRDPK